MLSAHYDYGQLLLISNSFLGFSTLTSQSLASWFSVRGGSSTTKLKRNTDKKIMFLKSVEGA